jgi:pimeloyl-ACP methyl ester carboxylesterase
VSVDGFYSLFEVVKSRMPGFFINGWLSGAISDEWFNSVCRFLSRFNFQLAWEFSQSYWCYGVNTPADVLRFMKTMSLEGPSGEKHLQSVQCPVLIMGGEQAFYFGPELNAVRMMEDLGHLDEMQKQLWIGEGGPSHKAQRVLT